MGAPRATTPPQEADADYGRVVALIAAILAGEIVVANVAATIAALLLRLVPDFLAELPEFAAKTAAVLVGLMLASNARGSAVPSITDSRRAVGVLVALDELGYRARWAANAISRIAGVEDKQKALKDERRYFALHFATSEKRRQGRLLNAAAAATYGPLLSWHHGPVTERSRPHHVKADGANYRVDSIPEETGALPSVLPNCKCYPGPPIPGARVMD